MRYEDSRGKKGGFDGHGEREMGARGSWVLQVVLWSGYGGDNFKGGDLDGWMDIGRLGLHIWGKIGMTGDGDGRVKVDVEEGDERVVGHGTGVDEAEGDIAAEETDWIDSSGRKWS